MSEEFQKSQEVSNNADVSGQLNIAKNDGSIYFTKKSRLSSLFEKLQQEVATDKKYEGIMEDFEHYHTKLDGVDMPTKLEHGGFSVNEITKATRRKEKYAKKLELNRFYESAQLIDSHLFAKIVIDFEAYVEPLINKEACKEDIIQAVLQKVICPIIDLINVEGEKDDILNYNSEDIYGMIYYLTGKCHINWKNYESI